MRTALAPHGPGPCLLRQWLTHGSKAMPCGHMFAKCGCARRPWPAPKKPNTERDKKTSNPSCSCGPPPPDMRVFLVLALRWASGEATTACQTGPAFSVNGCGHAFSVNGYTCALDQKLCAFCKTLGPQGGPKPHQKRKKRISKKTKKNSNFFAFVCVSSA